MIVTHTTCKPPAEHTRVRAGRRGCAPERARARLEARQAAVRCCARHGKRRVASSRLQHPPGCWTADTLRRIFAVATKRATQRSTFHARCEGGAHADSRPLVRQDSAHCRHTRLTVWTSLRRRILSEARWPHGVAQQSPCLPLLAAARSISVSGVTAAVPLAARGPWRTVLVCGNGALETSYRHLSKQHRPQIAGWRSGSRGGSSLQSKLSL